MDLSVDLTPSTKDLRLRIWSAIFCYPNPPKWYKFGDVEYDLEEFRKLNPEEYELLRIQNMSQDERVVLSCSYEIPASSSDSDFWCRYIIKHTKEKYKKELDYISNYKVCRKEGISPSDKPRIEFENNVLRLYLYVCWWRRLYNKLAKHHQKSEITYEGYTEYSLPRLEPKRGFFQSMVESSLSKSLSRSLPNSLPSFYSGEGLTSPKTPSLDEFLSGKLVPKNRFVIMELFSETEQQNMVSRLGLKIKKYHTDVDIADIILLGIKRIVRQNWMKRKILEIEYSYGLDFLIDTINEITAVEYEKVESIVNGKINPIKTKKYSENSLDLWCDTNLKDFMEEFYRGNNESDMYTNFCHKINHHYEFSMFRKNRFTPSWKELDTIKNKPIPKKWRVKPNDWKKTRSEKCAYATFTHDGFMFGVVVRKSKTQETEYMTGFIFKLLGIEGEDYREMYLYFSYKGVYTLTGRVGELPSETTYEIVE